MKDINFNEVFWNSLVNNIEEEFVKAKNKFPNWPNDPFHCLAIIGEEFGELQKEILQQTYERSEDINYEKIKSETIQTIAMLFRFYEHLHEYNYQKDWK